MTTLHEIKAAFDYLNSQEGTQKFLTERTLLVPKRVEKIYAFLGNFPIPEPAGWEQEQSCLDTIFDPNSDGLETTRAAGGLDALNQLRDMEIEEKERKLAAFERAVERGETPEPIPELELSSEIRDHLEEVARLSGEAIETVYEMYGAEFVRRKQLNQLVQQMIQLKAEEEK